MKINYFWGHGMSSIKAKGDPLFSHTHQATQSGMLMRNGLLKSGNLMNWWKLEQGDLFMNNHPVCSQSTRTNLLWMIVKWTLTPTHNQTCRYYPDHSCARWMIECERFKTNIQKMQQKTATNILWYGECSCFQHCKHLYPWGRITQTICIPSKTKEKILQWNRCSTHLKSWYPNNQTRSVGWIQWIGNTLHGSVVCGQWWTSHQFFAQKGPRIFRFCIVSWKDKRDPRIKLCMGRQIDVAQKFKITKKCESNARFDSLSLCAKRFGAGQWSFFGFGSDEKWYSISWDSPQGEWDRIAEQMMLTFAESTHPVFRSTSLLSRGVLKSISMSTTLPGIPMWSTSPFSRGVLESKRGWKIVNSLLRWGGNDWNCLSHNYFC